MAVRKTQAIHQLLLAGKVHGRSIEIVVYKVNDGEMMVSTGEMEVLII